MRTKRAYDPDRRHAEYLADRDHYRQYQRDWNATHRHHRRAVNANVRAAKYGVAGTLVAADVEFAFKVRGGRCVYCTRPATAIDHVVPLSRGGANHPSNIVPACRSCNSRKHASTVREWADRAAK